MPHHSACAPKSTCPRSKIRGPGKKNAAGPRPDAAARALASILFESAPVFQTRKEVHLHFIYRGAARFARDREKGCKPGPIWAYGGSDGSTAFSVTDRPLCGGALLLQDLHGHSHRTKPFSSGQPTSESMTMTTGTVKFFNNARGYGFIAPDDGSKDVFVHISAVEAAGITDLQEGQKLTFEIQPDTRGPKAVNLQAE
jgi:CspA family cold shock protein